jgi:hypothetical protein
MIEADVMNFCFATVVVILTALIPTSASHSQTIFKSNNIEVRFESCLLRASLLGNDATHSSRLIRDYSPFRRVGVPAGSYLASYPAYMYGLEKYELSPSTMVLLGASVGAQAGMFLGAVGNTLGLWSEKTTWALVGVMSVAGGSWFGIKANDPSWRSVYRWKDDHELAPIKR